jgi:iron-sulfur cluster assembly accessory protein
MAEITLSERAAARIKAITATGGLRVAVNGGGCSGFSYELAIVDGGAAEDLVISRDGAQAFIDPISAPMLMGSEIDWVEDLVGSSFKVRNPNAKSSCGCGVSFSL